MQQSLRLQAHASMTHASGMQARVPVTVPDLAEGPAAPKPWLPAGDWAGGWVWRQCTVRGGSARGERPGSGGLMDAVVAANWAGLDAANCTSMHCSSHEGGKRVSFAARAQEGGGLPEEEGALEPAGEAPIIAVHLVGGVGA